MQGAITATIAGGSSSTSRSSDIFPHSQLQRDVCNRFNCLSVTRQDIIVRARVYVCEFASKRNLQLWPALKPSHSSLSVRKTLFAQRDPSHTQLFRSSSDSQKRSANIGRARPTRPWIKSLEEKQRLPIDRGCVHKVALHRAPR